MLREFPLILEKTEFLSKYKYPSLEVILQNFCGREDVMIQLSMKSELVGSQGFLLVNSLFWNDIEFEGLVASSMMHIDDNKI